MLPVLRQSTSVAVLTATAVAILTTNAARAGNFVPLKFRTIGTAKVVGIDPDPLTGAPIVTIELRSIRRDTGTLLGAQTTEGGSFQINLATGESVLKAVVIGANGKDGYTSLYGPPIPVDPATNTFRYDVQITGGMGRFDGATGFYTTIISSDLTVPDLINGFLQGHVLVATYEGRGEGIISRPAPR
jgi:hypothetical protein